MRVARCFYYALKGESIEMIGTKLPGRILQVALLLGLIFNLLFFGRAIGISLFLFVLISIAALFWLGQTKGIRPKRRNLWLLGPLLIFAAMVAIRANPFLTFFNIVAVIFLLELVVHFYTAGSVQALGLADYPAVLAGVAGHSVMQAGPIVRTGVDFSAAQNYGQRGVLPAARGILLAAPILLFFTLLLASADIVFASYVSTALHLPILPKTIELAWRSILITGTAWLLAGALSYALLRGRSPEQESLPSRVISYTRKHVSLGNIEAFTILTAINLLFLSFVWIQFAYLFGGRANIHIDGFTYSEYARRGFFELVAVSFFTLALILGLNSITRRTRARHTLTFNSLSSLMVALVLVMLVSAFQRLQLYEMAFGYTQIRLYVHVFIVWLAVAFVWFLIVLWWPWRYAPLRNSPGRIIVEGGKTNLFAIGTFIAVLGFLVTLNVINPDAFIAHQNLNRYYQTGKLDANYLASLSADAIPEIIGSLARIEQEERLILCQGLGDWASDTDVLRRRQTWPSFHLAYWRAYRLVGQAQWVIPCVST
jgi:hypothetical protein